MKKIKAPYYWNDAKKFLSNKDKKLAKIISQYNGYLVTRNNPFHSLCRSIIGQQISVKAADSIWLKFERVVKKIKPINLIKLSKARLASLGLSRQKVEYLKIIAKEFFDKRLDIKDLQRMSDEEVIKHMIKIKGIGIWTAQMFLIFNLNRPNIFPFSDVGLVKAISKNYKKEYPLKKDQLDFFQKKWHPYTTVATWYMWRSIDPVPVEY
ncbi:MAG: DNA-3-methyladenine glycosylase 2 family protein [Proteobacteria bacterium]|nr:DNA-3-methyladenine glycosylase 2 family protein [Candidatus Fonsibacter sp. PEL5]